MHLLIAAAGKGSRMGADCNKLLLRLSGRLVLEWTLKAAFAAQSITWIGIVGQPIDKASITPLMKNTPKPLTWINGGRSRQESVQLGLNSLPIEAKHVLIHDGARCLVEPTLFDKCAEIVLSGQAVIAGSKVTDTIKKVDSQGYITATPERSQLWAAQTPQGFSVSQLKEAHSQAISNDWNVTDDASLYERLGWSVQILEAPPSNIKVTTPFDLAIAEALISAKQKES